MTPKLLRQARFLAHQFKPFNIEQTLRVLKLLGCDHDTVYWKDKATTPNTICQNLYQEYHPANVKEVWFYGGPPSRKGWWCGTLYQFIIDRLMRDLNTTSAGDMIRKLKLGKKHASKSSS